MDNPRLPYLHEKTLSLPMEPGVYIMHDKSGKVIYVGKAKKLKNRGDIRILPLYQLSIFALLLISLTSVTNCENLPVHRVYKVLCIETA